MRSLLERILACLGVAVIPLWRLEEREFANHMRKLFGRYGIDCVLDVGANRGQYRDFLRHHVGYAGPILSFEPVRVCVERLDERARGDANWHIYPFALGSERKESDINVMQADRLSSFLEPRDGLQDEVGNQNKVSSRELVRVARLDDLWDGEVAARGFRSVYLKMDTQGYDLEVIRGAAACMQGIVALQSEMSVSPLYNDMASYREAMAILEASGFVPSAMFPVYVDQRVRLIEFDCVMLNERARPAEADAAR